MLISSEGSVGDEERRENYGEFFHFLPFVKCRVCRLWTGYAAGLMSTSRYASPNPPPLSADEIIANGLSGPSGPVVPHRGATARALFVEPESSGSQAGPAFIRQGVGVNRLHAHRSRRTPRRPVQHRAGIPRAVRAKPGNLGREAVVQARRYWPANNRNPAQRAGLVGYANSEAVPNHRAAVPVQFAHKLVRGFQVGGHYSQFHQSSGMQVHVSQSQRADRIFMASATAHLPPLKVPPLVGSLAVIASR